MAIRKILTTMFAALLFSNLTALEAQDNAKKIADLGKHWKARYQ